MCKISKAREKYFWSQSIFWNDGIKYGGDVKKSKQLKFLPSEALNNQFLKTNIVN